MLSVAPPGSTTCKGPDNSRGEDATFGVLLSQNHLSCKLKTSYYISDTLPSQQSHPNKGKHKQFTTISN